MAPLPIADCDAIVAACAPGAVSQKGPPSLPGVTLAWSHSCLLGPLLRVAKGQSCLGPLLPRVALA
eukprot:3301401-Pyramimonas_sp.AAC.1